MDKLVGLFRRYWRWIVWIPLGLFLAFQLYFFFQIGWWVHHNPSSTSFMRQQLSVLREKNPKAKLRHKWIPYKRISRNLKRAVIASEDANFTDHEGVDWDALLKAYEKNSRKGKIVAGGSTITQQLPKISFCLEAKAISEKDRKSLSLHAGILDGKRTDIRALSESGRIRHGRFRRRGGSTTLLRYIGLFTECGTGSTACRHVAEAALFRYSPEFGIPDAPDGADSKTDGVGGWCRVRLVRNAGSSCLSYSLSVHLRYFQLGGSFIACESHNRFPF